MKVSEAFPSKYLKADDINGKIAVNISDVVYEPVGVDKTPKLVAYFRELDKPMVLNHTNADMIGLLHGEETDTWKGKRIILMKVLVPFQGKNVPAIRVGDTVPGVKQKPPQEEPSEEDTDWIDPDEVVDL